MDAALFTSRLLGAAMEDYVEDCLHDEFVHDSILVEALPDAIDTSLLRPVPPPVPVNKTAQAAPRRPAALHIRQQGPVPALRSVTTAPPAARLDEPALPESTSEEEAVASTQAPSEAPSEVEVVPKGGATFQNELAKYMSCLFEGVLSGAARVFDAPMAMDQDLIDVEEQDVGEPLLPSAYGLGACSRPVFSNKCSLLSSVEKPLAEQLPADCLLLSSLVAQSLPETLSTEPIECSEEHCTLTSQKVQTFSELLHPATTSGETSCGNKSPVPPSAPRGPRRPGRALDSSIHACSKEENSFVPKGLAPQPPSAPRILQGPGRRPQRSAACAAPKQGDASEAPADATRMPTGTVLQQIKAQQQLKPIQVPPRASSLHSRPQIRQSLGGSAMHRGSSVRTAMELDLEGEVTAPTSMAGPWLSMPAAPASMSTTAQTSSYKMLPYKVSVDAGAAGISLDAKSPRFLPSINQKGRNVPGASANWSIGAEETWRGHAAA